ncbi:sigma-54-dependent Fis family transcriptional regulator [Candidatus Sumerlaeota bacterium]|nr:sigma-54-dependent Fis family transcriptional regulator [Candidatus Sumerlaeota bacterium]
MTEILERFLVQRGHLVQTFQRADDALAHVRKQAVDLVLTDILLSGMSGLKLVQALRDRPDPPQVIIMTALEEINDAVEAMRLGAFHYLLKPFNMGEVRIVIDKALERRRLEREVSELRHEVEQRYEFANIIAKSQRMLAIFDLIRRVAPTNATVLITGSSGTGKELVARALHVHSLRRREPFVSVNCTALPETLLESELFGHVRGSFTGAIADKRGLFEEADGGTVFLDEIGEISPLLQQRLLRVLQEREFFRVGESTVRSVDVRILAATNRNLHEEVKSGRFREDLFYRLHVVNIHLPDLQERREDIPLLADHFLRRICRENSLGEKTIWPDALERLMSHDWPGNVRELENVLERAAVLTRGSAITADDLPLEVRERGPRVHIADALKERITLEELERRYIVALFESLGRSRTKAASVLGIDRKTLYRKLMKYRAEGHL